MSNEEEPYFVVELEPLVWIAPWEGDPGRTTKFKNAEKFPTVEKAQEALEKAQKYRNFNNSRIMKWKN
jgi:hypothetical protein